LHLLKPVLSNEHGTEHSRNLKKKGGESSASEISTYIIKEEENLCAGMKRFRGHRREQINIPQWLCALVGTACVSGWTTGILFFKPFPNYREKPFYIVGPEKGWGVGEGSGGRAG
jgi:hypothetical protein